jgi:hypothetical protein
MLHLPPHGMEAHLGGTLIYKATVTMCHTLGGLSNQSLLSHSLSSLKSEIRVVAEQSGPGLFSGM